MMFRQRRFQRLAALFCLGTAACEEPFYCDQPLSCDTDAAVRDATVDASATNASGSSSLEAGTSITLDDAGDVMGSADADSGGAASSEITTDEIAATSTSLDASVVTPTSSIIDGGAPMVDAATINSTACEGGNGACDSLTQCIPDDGGRTCSACPNGYLGSGEVGCQPTLLGLVAAPSALSPAFAPIQQDYTVQLPVWVDTIALGVEIPDGSTLRLNGEDFGASVSWTSPSLLLGDNSFELEVLREGVDGNRYQLVVTRGDVAYLKADNPTDNARFGYAMALSADGTTLAVGARFEDISEAQPDAGAAYLFTRGPDGWTQQARLTASNAGGLDQFGTSVSLSDDGSVLVVGAPSESSDATGVNGEDNENAANSGAVYVFERVESEWAQKAYIKASTSVSERYFGEALALSADGVTLAVAARGDDSGAQGIGGDQFNTDANRAGAVFVFHRDSGSWEEQAYVKASNTDRDDYFGSALALAADGNTLAVGALREDSKSTGVGGDQSNDEAEDSGAVYVFERAFAAWSQKAYIKASNTSDGNLFGAAMSLSGDGLTLAVYGGDDAASTGVNEDQSGDGANNSGAVYVFTRNANKWAQQAYIKPTNTGADDDFDSAQRSPRTVTCSQLEHRVKMVTRLG